MKCSIDLAIGLKLVVFIELSNLFVHVVGHDEYLSSELLSILHFLSKWATPSLKQEKKVFRLFKNVNLSLRKVFFPV